VDHTERFTYNDHGSMTSMGHLPDMVWDFEDQLQMIDRGGGGKAYYLYDAAGQRVRKVIENQDGLLQEERLYLGGFEIHRKFNGNGITLERETLHVMDDKQRIALVETRTQGTDPAPAQLIRYQLGNHLGSATLELDDEAQIISYEEYYPYGSTSYQAVRNQIETPKRYRYTGKERDEESGLYYHGARYYATWIGKWTSADPASLADGVNCYWYAQSRPIVLSDPSGFQSQPSEERINPKIVSPGRYTGNETQEQIRAKYAEKGIFYTGEAEWDKDRKTWWVDRSQLTESPVVSPEVGSSDPISEGSEISPPDTASSEQSGALEQVTDYLRESETGQFFLGLVTGGIAGAAPGGFTAGIAGEATGISRDLPRAYRMGYGLGEAAWGIAQTVVGVQGAATGAAASSTGVGAVVGVPALAASLAVIAEGGADVSVGFGVFMSAVGEPPSNTGAPSPKEGAGNLRAISDSQLNRQGIDAHKVKQDILGRRGDISRWNIAKDSSGRIWLVPRQKGGGAPIDTGLHWDELPLHYPR
jgi:RHS repeat-associated protein